MKKDRAAYQIKKIDPGLKEWRKEAAPGAVACFPWKDRADYAYCPVTNFTIGAGDAGLHVFMETDEDGIRAEEKGFSPRVYTDSCMEFFLMPDPRGSARYLNWEFNPAGAMYLSLGTRRHDRVDIHEENYRDLFQVRTAPRDKGWCLEYTIPVSFLRRFFPPLEWKPGHVMRGNLYKCGDRTARPHFGCWAPISLPEPDFHCPDFFGDLTLE